MDDTWLPQIQKLTNIVHLDISRAGNWECISDDAVIEVLRNMRLETLILDYNLSLTDRTLIEGIKPYCPNLRILSLGHLANISPQGIIEIFSTPSTTMNTTLTELSIERCRELNDDAIEAILNHSGRSLTRFNVNSIDNLEHTLRMIGEKCPEMKYLDVSFVRE